MTPEVISIEPGERYVLFVQKGEDIMVKGFNGDMRVLCHWLHEIAYRMENNMGVSYNGKDTPNG